LCLSQSGFQGAEGETVVKLAISCIIALVIAAAAVASETITYTYDAKGRLTKVVRTGTVNNNVTTDYTHDKANNRKAIVTTNSPNTPPP
jgi:YD repeat-containing protein